MYISTFQEVDKQTDVSKLMFSSLGVSLMNILKFEADIVFVLHELSQNITIDEWLYLTQFMRLWTDTCLIACGNVFKAYRKKLNC